MYHTHRVWMFRVTTIRRRTTERVKCLKFRIYLQKIHTIIFLIISVELKHQQPVALFWSCLHLTLGSERYLHFLEVTVMVLVQVFLVSFLLFCLSHPLPLYHADTGIVTAESSSNSCTLLFWIVSHACVCCWPQLFQCCQLELFSVRSYFLSTLIFAEVKIKITWDRDNLPFPQSISQVDFVLFSFWNTRHWTW